MITPINHSHADQSSQSIYIKIGQKPMQALVSELCSMLYAKMYDKLEKAEYIDMVNNIMPVGTHANLLKAVRKQICKYGLTRERIRRYDCFAGIIIPHIKRGGRIEFVVSPITIIVDASNKMDIGAIVRKLSYFYTDEEGTVLSGKKVRYADKISQQTKYDIGSNFHYILMAAKFFKEFTIRIVSPTDEIISECDVIALRQDLKNQYKAMKT